MTSSRRKEFGDSSVLRVEFGSPFQATGRLNVEAALDHIEQSVRRVCVSVPAILKDNFCSHQTTLDLYTYRQTFGILVNLDAV